MWGDGRYGKLGLGTVDNKYSPTLVNDNDVNMGKITQLAIGQNHTLAVNSEFKVYSWGYSDKGKLGHCQKAECDGLQKRLFPVEIQELRDKKVTFLFAGINSSMVLTAKGELMGWGEGINCFDEKKMEEHIEYKPVYMEASKTFGSVGRNKFGADISAESKLTNLKVKISKVSCGYSHTLAVTNNFLVFVWGSGMEVAF